MSSDGAILLWAVDLGYLAVHLGTLVAVRLLGILGALSGLEAWGLEKGVAAFL